MDFPIKSYDIFKGPLVHGKKPFFKEKPYLTKIDHKIVEIA